MPLTQAHAQLLRAYMLATGFALAARHERFNQCFEAVVAGELALRRRGISARRLPCGIVGRTADDRSFTVGLTTEEIFEFDATGESLTEWRARQAREGGVLPPDDALCAHLVLEAFFGDERVIVDPTYGQLRQDHGLHVPMVYAVSVPDGLPMVERRGFRLGYIASHREAPIRAHSVQFEPTAMTDDIHDLIQLALRYNGDEPRFYDELARQAPEVTRTVAQRLAPFTR
jgi:hypothetical protein